MKWDRLGQDEVLVSESGEILDRIRWKGWTGGYVVESTGKTYIDKEAAKKAAWKEPVFMPKDFS